MQPKFDRRNFLQLAGSLTGCLCSGFLLGGCGEDSSDQKDLQSEIATKKDRENSKFKKFFVLGIDGFDPKVLTDLMDRGEMPNFKKLSRTGSYQSLDVSNPAQSPVAWAEIATGNDSGYHGLFDFIHRRIEDYKPELSIFKVNPKNFLNKRDAMFLPVMKGNSFWDITSSKGIPSKVIRWPVTFPPKRNKAKVLSGLGVPDLTGGAGNYTFYTNKNFSKPGDGINKVVKIDLENDRVKTFIYGPQVATFKSQNASKVEMGLRVKGANSIDFEIQENRFALNQGQWSDWHEVTFKVGFTRTVKGIVKFYLIRVKPDIELYMTPIHIDPKDPAYIISNPDTYSSELSQEVGLFHTLGIPEDTKALTEGVIDEEAFISMCDQIIDEQEKMLNLKLDRFEDGLLSFVFYTIDRVQHIFWVTKDPEHPLYSEEYSKKYGWVIDHFYKRMDKVLGMVMDSLDKDAGLLVCSDHGFNSYRRSVHINTWLAQNGFLNLNEEREKDLEDDGPLFKFVDFKRTQAYSLGFGGIYLNLKGREKNGVVESEEEANSILQDISDKLLKFKDPKDGRSVIKAVYRGKDIYHGQEASRAPDLIIGFNEGFRISWQTALGGTPPRIIEDNEEKWTGDHIVDPSLVPGILLTNFQTSKDSPHLRDIAPTVLTCFGIQPEGIRGTSLI